MEVLKMIKGYEGWYEISSIGNVKSCKRKGNLKEKILKYFIGTTGYKTIVLSKNGIQKKFKIHRLVAFAFLNNPRNFNIVNHIDGNKLNNDAANLEFCTYGQNNLHAYRTGLRKVSPKAIANMKIATSVSVNQYDKNNILLNSYKSLSDASRATGICFKAISACVTKRTKTSGGFIWKPLSKSLSK